MSLSSILIKETPKYELALPSSKEKFNFRPFLVKEEKILLISQDGGNLHEMYSAIRDVVESCVEGIENVQDMPLFDVEYIFIQLRAKSVGEVVFPTFTCPETGEHISTSINLTSINVKFPKNHTANIKISENVYVKMKYPTISMILNNESEEENIYDTIAFCIESISNKKESFSTNDFSPEEIKEFVDHLTNEQFTKLMQFLETSPRIEHEEKYTTSDGVERRIMFSGLGDFFL